MTLHRSQAAALACFTSWARGRKEGARRVIDEVLRMSNIAADAYEVAVARVKTQARVALHFHPDRPDASGATVAAALAAGGVYKSQFETLLSNGSVSAFPGGDRDRWERQLFGGAYDLEGTTAAHRPKYGALDLMLHPDGPAPRFGSAYLLLRPEVSRRCTFTYLDSHQDPKEKGTFDEFDDIVAALLGDAFTRDFAIGEPALTAPRLIAHLGANLPAPIGDRFARAPARNLNHYIEAQVHGDVRLADDVEALVADPSFKETETGRTLAEMSVRYGFALHWHAGFTLAATEVPGDFRGPTMPSLARRVARDGAVDAAAIGRAARELAREPGSWADRGSPPEVLQELKLLWHVLVRFGAAAAMLALVVVGWPRAAQAGTPDPARLFAGRDGCFELYDVKAQKLVVRTNPRRCAERVSPWSTFKVPLALMAFDAGVLADENATRKFTRQILGERGLY